MALKSHFF